MMTLCHSKPSSDFEEELPPDTLTMMERLEENGVLVAATNCGDLNFRIFRGRPGGFQFDLLDDFTEQLDLNLDLHVDDSLPRCYSQLRKGQINLYAGVFDTLVVDTTFHYFVFDVPGCQASTFAWVIPKREGDSSLVATINEWKDDFEGPGMKHVYYLYYNGKERKSDSLLGDPTCLSDYDEIIRGEAKEAGLDWRLLAAIIYQESHFKPDLESPRGAYGMMQLMPVTMRKYGITHESPVEDQIEAGIKLLQHFNKELPESISDSVERRSFILASYNAGMGHVLEARHRAERHGKDPNLWKDNVEFYTPKQTYYFVKEITKRYHHYQSLIE